MTAKEKQPSRTKELERDVSRLSGINGILAEKNESLQDENRQLREALDKYLFTKASDIKTKDVLLNVDKFAQIFVAIRNSQTEAILLQLSEDGTKVASVIPKKKDNHETP